MGHISKKTWIIVGIASAAIVLIIAFASCSAPREEPRGAASLQRDQASAVGCYPPLACGPYYADYVPSYYQAHPASLYLSPYRTFYTPVFNGRSYSVSRTPAGLAPVTSRPPMPYPPGYKAVPGDFQPPTAPKNPAPQTPVKAPAPAGKAAAMKTSRR